MTEQRTPLWEVINDAYHNAIQEVPLNFAVRAGTAAELRAIADEVERRGRKRLDLDPGETADWLRAAADEAGSGDDGNA